MSDRNLTTEEMIARNLGWIFGAMRPKCTKFAADGGLTLEQYAARMVMDLITSQLVQLTPKDN